MPVSSYMKVTLCTSKATLVISKMNYMSLNKSISRESKSSLHMPYRITESTSGSLWCTNETDGSRFVQIWSKALATFAPTLILILTKCSRVSLAGSYQMKIVSRGNYWRVSKKDTTLASEVKQRFSIRRQWAARHNSNKSAYQTW